MIELPQALPVLFSPAMVRAERAGLKNQTRRVVKPQPQDVEGATWLEHPQRPGFFAPCRDELGRGVLDAIGPAIRCPYGTGGTHLYVRERMRVIELRGGAIRVRYEADGAESDWIAWPGRLKGTPRVGHCLAYGGFREASRTLLRVQRVRVEQLQAISERDARAEGVTAAPFCRAGRPRGMEHVDAFESLWDSINSKRPGCAWTDNPVVWVVDFERSAPQREAA